MDNPASVAFPQFGWHDPAAQQANASDAAEAARHLRRALRLREAGKLEEALVHFRRAAELTAYDAIAQTNLGQALLALGRAEEAIAPCRIAVTLEPDRAILHLVLADALRFAELYDDAREAYCRAIALAPTLARAHAHLGLLHRDMRRVQDAFAPLKRAVELEPRNASFWKYLAEADAEWEDLPEAIRCWQRAIELQPNEPAFRLGLGKTLQRAGMMQEAERELHRALRLSPGVAEAHLALGHWHEVSGNTREAERAFRAALAIDPALTRAQFSLAQLLGKRLPDADICAMQDRLANPALPTACRIKLQFALAGVGDARGEYAIAAQTANQANALASRQVTRRGGYDPARHRAFVDRLIEAFSTDFFTRTANLGSASECSVFIVGLPRSGTTLVHQILASHPRVHGAGELNLAWQSFMNIPESLGVSDDVLACVPKLEAASLHRLADRHLASLATRDQGQAERIVDKMPDNYLYLGLLAAMFPRATFIHCRRDLRDVAVSCWFTHFQSVAWSHEVEHIGSRFDDYRRVMEHWRRVLPITLHEADYEQLVGDPERVARSLIAACKLDWDPACLAFHRQLRPVHTASAQQVREPIYTRSVGRWRHYERELADLVARVASGSRDVE